MPPRLDLFSRLRFPHGSPICAAATRSFTTTPIPCASTVAQKRRHQDPYALAQARSRRQANLSRQEVLQAERSKTYGDPVRGLTTPFLESFDTAKPASQPDAPSDNLATDRETPKGITAPFSKDNFLNYFVSEAELKRSIDHSEHLTVPLQDSARGSSDPAKAARLQAAHRQGHAIAAEALARIVSLENSSSRDRTRINKQRCIETFGRHNTDTFLRPKPPSTAHVSRPWDDYVHVKESSTLPEEIAGEEVEAVEPQGKTPRAGPDTGSSEVQIAILTAKIRTLANFLETRGRKDKVNKRNLRLMVHRRQKLLAYLRKKERGGERWQRVTEMLGLGEGTWRGEISL